MLKNTDKKKISKNDYCTFFQEKKNEFLKKKKSESRKQQSNIFKELKKFFYKMFKQNLALCKNSSKKDSEIKIFSAIQKQKDR